MQDSSKGPHFPQYAVTVYAEILLLRTWALLRDQAELTSPENVSKLVDRVYGDDEVLPCPVGWERRWETAIRKREAARTHDAHLAKQVYLPPASPRLQLSDLTVRATSSGHTRKGSGRRR